MQREANQTQVMQSRRQDTRRATCHAVETAPALTLSDAVTASGAPIAMGRPERGLEKA